MLISPIYTNKITNKNIEKLPKPRKLRKQIDVKIILNEDNITKFINKGLQWYK
jgi:hypothetical protein